MSTGILAESHSSMDSFKEFSRYSSTIFPRISQKILFEDSSRSSSRSSSCESSNSSVAVSTEVYLEIPTELPPGITLEIALGDSPVIALEIPSKISTGFNL